MSIVLWLTGISFTGVYFKRALLAALVLALLATLAFIYKITRMKKMLSFNKKNKLLAEEKAQELIDQPVPFLATHSEPNPSSDAVDAIKPIRAKKDTFISNGALFTGVIEGDGNIIVEGRVEGNIICSHMVRIETSGHVKGEIRAQQIMINGAVEGRCFTDSMSIQPKGSMRGDIFADEISIEKGGLFIGQSQLMQKTPTQAQPAQAKVTALKKVETEQQEQPTPQPSKQAN
ncbi:bactofilin family protein [Serratia silvae]|uniref:Polymer-forming cytoskeletal protein n=1 Tax=Serratia silvae TaxID=2824122 RepID=A0ABT0KE63_9GAMM|nr:polymer-forming cytoskeletal protein [Serratia silvae]MCL1030034.1 polymer-forming cytoskeletal protein [Serratia silvae]